MTLTKHCILACLALLASGVTAKTCTWTGEGNDMKWSTPQNWGGSSASDVPASGDTVVVNLSSSSVAVNTNDIAGLTLAGLTFTGSTVATTFVGEKIALVENGTATIAMSKSGSTSYVPFGLPPTASLSFDCALGFTLGGVVSGNGTVRKLGAGKLTISATSTDFTGTWKLENGQVLVYTNPNAFGQGVVELYGANKTSGSSGNSSIIFYRDITVANDIHVYYDAEIHSQRGVTLSGDIVYHTGNASEKFHLISDTSDTYYGTFDLTGTVRADSEMHAGGLQIEMSHANHAVRFKGPALALQDKGLSLSATEGTVFLGCPITSTYTGNDFLTIGNGVKIVMGCENALPVTSKITFGTATIASGLRGGIDLNGYDQSVAMIYATPSTASATNRQYLTSLAGPATLSVLNCSTTSNRKYNDFLNGEASLALIGPAGLSSTVTCLELYGENTSSGRIVSSVKTKSYLNGTFPNLSGVDVSGPAIVYVYCPATRDMNNQVEYTFNNLSGGYIVGSTAQLACGRVMLDGVDIPAGNYTKTATWLGAGSCAISDHVYRWVWTGAGGDGLVSTASNWATNVAPGDAAAPVVLDFGGALPSQVIKVPTPLTIAGMTSGANTSPVCLKGPGTLTVSGAESNALVATFNDGLSLVHSGTGTQTFSCPSASALRSLSVEAGHVAFVDGSIVENLGTVSLAAGARLELGENVIPVCNGLSLAGVAQPTGKYGSTSSQARYQMDAFFDGTGYLWYKGGVIIVVR